MNSPICRRAFLIGLAYPTAFRALAAPTNPARLAFGNRKELTGHGNIAIALAWSPDSRRIASAGWDNTVRVWAVGTAQQEQVKGSVVGRGTNLTQDVVHAVAWSPDGKQIAWGDHRGDVHLGRAASLGDEQTLRAHEGALRSLKWSPSGKVLATAGTDSQVRLWDSTKPNPIQSIGGLRHWGWTLDWSPDGKTLATDEVNSIRMINVVTGSVDGELCGHRDAVTSVHWSPDGQLLISGSRDREVRVWSPEVRAPIRVLQGHKGVVQTVGWHPGGQFFASGGEDRTVRVWHWPTARLVAVLSTAHTNSWVRCLAWSPNGQQLAAGCSTGEILLWEVASGANET